MVVGGVVSDAGAGEGEHPLRAVFNGPRYVIRYGLASDAERSAALARDLSAGAALSWRRAASRPLSRAFGGRCA
jgi:hypothetical protein